MELQELHSYIQVHQPNICQLSVLRDGNEIYSAEWNSYQKTDCVHIASDTKSVMALLIGIAIDHKMIGIAKTNEQRNAIETSFTEEGKTIMMENVLSFLRAAAPWISMGLLIAFLCVRPAIRKGKAEDDYAEEGMCVGMCLGLMLGSLSDSSNSGLGASLGMLFGLVIGLCMHKKGSEDHSDEK